MVTGGITSGYLGTNLYAKGEIDRTIKMDMKAPGRVSVVAGGSGSDV